VCCLRSVIPDTQEEEIRRVWVIPGQLEQKIREMPFQSINELVIMVHACVILIGRRHR
jgi:hypothetical protein